MKSALMEDLKDRTDVDMKNGYYSVGYDSPKKVEDRRNEVWIPKIPTPSEEGQLVLGSTVVETHEVKRFIHGFSTKHL